MGKKTVSRRLARQSRREIRQNSHQGKESFSTTENNIHYLEPTKEYKNLPVTKIEPLNVNQEKYIQALEEKLIVFGTGSAGSAKTYIATVIAANKLIKKEIDRIVITRPILSADEDMGFLPGDINEKFAPYFRPVYDVLLEVLGPTYLQYCLKPGIEKIQIAPFSFLRGRTFKNATVILDEAQNTTINQMKLFLTRIGDNSNVCINGDVQQCDLPSHKQSGLSDALTRFTENKLVGMIQFTKEDCVRSDICKLALAVYD